MVFLSSLEKSIELRSINKAKEKLDISYTEKKLLKEDLDSRKKILLEDVRLLKERIDSEYQYESWMLPELQKLEQELSGEESLKENWNNISNNAYALPLVSQITTIFQKIIYRKIVYTVFIYLYHTTTLFMVTKCQIISMVCE